MLVSEFHFELPPEQIAQEPLADRAASRLLHIERRGRTWQDRAFRDFPSLLRPSDLLVMNNTRVFPARLYGHRGGVRAQRVGPHNPAARDFLQGRVEVLLTRQVSAEPNEWECLVRPGRKIGVGEKLYFDTAGYGDRTLGDPHSAAPHELEAEVIERGTFGERRVRFAPVADFFACVQRIGHVPLPPYIDRADRASDRERYQTIYARARGSVAAPTAGLHFTPQVLGEIRARGVAIAEITLHVGLGTFQPVRVATVEEHTLHREHYEISDSAARAIQQAKAEGRRVVAVGTTTVRTLEHAAQRAERQESGLLLEAGSGEADVFLHPGCRFRVVDALLTNFHLPESTLLMLVCALGGKDFVLEAYRHAVAAGYRFYSYGDCMLVE